MPSPAVLFAGDAADGCAAAQRNDGLSRIVAFARIHKRLKGGKMLGRHVYRVTSPSDGRWVVAKEGEDKLLASRPTREAATELAFEFASADPPSKVVIENPDGTLEDECAFGDDPGMKVLD
jgi:hypothetical protein